MNFDAETKNNKIEKGSPKDDEPVFICIGKIHRTHGIHGDVVLSPMTDFPERIRAGRVIYIGEAHRPAKITRVRQQPPSLLIGISDYNDEVEAAELRNTYIYVRSDELPKLPEGEYYFHQLLGCTAIDPEGKSHGIITEILETGANNVYVIKKSDGQEELVPAVPEYVMSISIPRKEILIKFPEWVD